MISSEPERTARKTVYREGPLRAYRYERQTPGLEGVPPVVLVYSFINRPTIFDLLPDRSVVRSLLAAGHDVFLVDWGQPGHRESKLDLGGHVSRLERAVRAAADAAGSKQVSLLGYCLGGTVALVFAALHAELVTRIALLATPVAFESAGTLALWVRESGFDPEKLTVTTTTGNVSGELLRESFKWLDPMGQARKWITLTERAEDPDFVESFVAQERWANSCVDFPGALFSDLLVKLYRQDQLAKNELVVNERRVALNELEVPVLNVISEGDRIVPEPASLALESLVGKNVRTVRVPGGHIGMTVGRKAPKTTHAELARFLASKETTS